MLGHFLNEKEKKRGGGKHHKPHQKLSSTQPEDPTRGGIIASTNSRRAAPGLCLGRRDSYFAPTACVQRVISFFLRLSPHFLPGDQSQGLFLSGWRRCLRRTRRAVCHRAGTLVNSTTEQRGGVTALFTVHILLLNQGGNLYGRGPRMAHVLPFCQGWGVPKVEWGFFCLHDAVVCCPVVPSPLGALNISRAPAVLTGLLDCRARFFLAGEPPSGNFRANASQGLIAGRGGEDRGGGCETGAWQEGLSQLTESYRRRQRATSWLQ